MSSTDAGWLRRALTEIERYADRNPDFAQRVHDYPSGFMPETPCPSDCRYCQKAKPPEPTP